MTSRRSIIVSLMLGLFLSLFSLLEANAQVPRSISYQGQLIKDGQPYTGAINNLTIKIYDAAGTNLFEESYSGVQVDKGIFNLLLGGNDNHLPGYLKFDQQYFLGINIDGVGELSPRTPFVAAPYALNSQTVGGIGVSTVPTAGMLLPLDANGKIPSSVLPQGAQAVETINGVSGGPGGDLLLTSLDGSVGITTNAAGNSIDLKVLATGGSTITSVQAGPGLVGGGSTGVVTLSVASQGITTAMLGTGVVTGIKLDQNVAGLGLVQDFLGNLNINHNATLEIVGDALGLNLANPNTWSALQTFNAGITVNGPVTVNGTPEPNAPTDPVGVTFEEVINGDLRVAGFTWLQGNTRVNGLLDLRGNVINTGGDVTVDDNFHVMANTDLDGTLNVDGQSTTNGITNTGDIDNTGNFNQTGDINNTGNFTQTGDINNTGNLTNTGNGMFIVGPLGNVTVSGTPEAGSANAASVFNWELVDDGDLMVTGFSNLQGNTQVDGNTMLLGTLDVSGATTLNGLTNNGTSTLNGATTINNTLNVTGASTFNGITNNGTLTQNGVSTFNATVNVTGPNVTNIGGALNVTGLATTNGGLTNNGVFTQNGNMTQSGGSVTLNGATTINNTLTTTGNLILGNASTNNTFGGPGSANRFNGTSNFGTLPATNGNKLIVDGVVSNSAVPPPSTIPGGDYEFVVNGDAQITGYTNLNNAFVNNLTIGGTITFPPAATACFGTVQVQNLSSWCSAPGSAINLTTALNQSGLGSSANNTFLATNFTGIAKTLALLDVQASIVNTSGSDGGNVTINDGLHVSGVTSNTTLDGDANIFGMTGRGSTPMPGAIAITPPFAATDELTPNNTNSIRGHAQFIGTGAGLNERKIFVHGVAEGPGAVVPNNSIPPVTSFEVEIVGDLYVQGTIVGGGIPQIRSYDATLVPGAGPNGGGGFLYVAPAGGVDANDAVHVQYQNFGNCTGSLVASIVGGNVQIESSCALDNALVKLTIIRYP